MAQDANVRLPAQYYSAKYVSSVEKLSWIRDSDDDRVPDEPAGSRNYSVTGCTCPLALLAARLALLRRILQVGATGAHRYRRTAFTEQPAHLLTRQPLPQTFREAVSLSAHDCPACVLWICVARTSAAFLLWLRAARPPSSDAWNDLTAAVSGESFGSQKLSVTEDSRRLGIRSARLPWRYSAALRYVRAV
jgi:hypothetical protein